MAKSKCHVCKGNMKQGITDLTLRRNRSVVVVDEVPAMVCEHCGEAVIDSEVSKTVYDMAEKEIQRGVTLEFCKFSAA